MNSRHALPGTSATPQQVSLDRLDDDFELAAAACVAVEIPAASEGQFHRRMQAVGYFVEQMEDRGDDHLICYLRPDCTSMQPMLLVALAHGPVRLPETERGRQIADELRRDFLDSELARNLVRNGAFR